MAQIDTNESLSNLSSRIRLGITPGEPAGIGPDICIQSAAAAAEHADLIYYCDPALLISRSNQLGIDITVNNLAENTFLPGAMNVQPIILKEQVICGQANVKNASYVIESLTLALEHCRSGNTQAIVTGPVNKGIISDSGVKFSGHTEWFAEQTNTPRVVMMLAGAGLKVALVTTHLPLADVSAAITEQVLIETINVVHSSLISNYGLEAPRLMVCGLNPHAGENGHLGREEKDVIEPVIQRFQHQGMDIVGPVPADTAFTERSLANADVVIAMYHDQGLPVLKHAAFGDAVNITLGLPIIRTSVDHGTAFDLAGTGQSNSSSFLSAIKAAIELNGASSC
ncbi:MAG: 4-hydroxythreonine-4-phosphate dehydrogenase [Candidatus Azotimanducaceae bacterium]|jgi:4-hydroxythreonine-4-phosphate dehydrogenase